MFCETSLFGGHLLAVYLIVVVIKAGVLALALTSGSGTEGVQLGSELRLGLDEGTTIITHRLVPGIGVTRKQGEAGSDKDHEK